MKVRRSLYLRPATCGPRVGELKVLLVDNNHADARLILEGFRVLRILHELAAPPNSENKSGTAYPAVWE